MRTPEVSRQTIFTKVPEDGRWQVMVVEYAMLDAYRIHLRQRVWTSALVLITLLMVGITSLGTRLPSGFFRLPVVTFVAVVATLLTVLCWSLLRRILSYMRITEHRKREIERDLGMRMELYLGFARDGRRRRGAQELVRDLAVEQPDLERDRYAFLESPVTRAVAPTLPDERLVWNLLPILLIAAWITLWVIVG